MRFSISVHNASAEMLSMKVSAKLEKNVGIVTSESKARWEYNPTKKSLRKRKYKPHCGFMLVQVLGSVRTIKFPSKSTEENATPKRQNMMSPPLFPLSTLTLFHLTLSLYFAWLEKKKKKHKSAVPHLRNCFYENKKYCIVSSSSLYEAHKI